MTGYELAQVNYSRLLAPLDSPLLADFVAALEPINALADAAPGFRWRLQTEDGDATAIRAFEWDVGDSAGVIVNMSVWSEVAHLADFVYHSAHRAILAQRREWFEAVDAPTAALWWVPAGHRPSVPEAEARIRRLRHSGPTPEAFTLRRHFPPPDAVDPRRAASGAGDWLCPA